MAKKIFNWGIIGLGKVAHQFADDLLLVPGARLYAVASSSLDRARAFAERYKVPHALGSYSDMVVLSELDAVYVASIHPQHCTHSLLCLKYGIPVLCESHLP